MTKFRAGSNLISMCCSFVHPPKEVSRGMKVPLCLCRNIGIWALGRRGECTRAKPPAKSLQGQAGSPAASWEATVQLHGATLDPKVHIRTASRAYILFLDLALCQNHRVQCLHGLQREDTKCDLAQAVTTIYCQHLSQILLPRVKMFTCPLILNGPGCMSNANERDSWSI